MRVISKTNMGRVQACSEWRDLRINKDTFVQRSTQYQWEVTWTAIQQVKHFRCTSFKRNSLWSFIIKILHQQLPVGRWLRKRKPSLYRNFNCQFCNRKADETILHLITCPDTVLLRQLIYEALWAFLADTLPQFSESLSSASLVASEINGWIGISAQSTRFKDLLIGAVAGKMDSAQFTYIQGRFKWSHHHTDLGNDPLSDVSILDDPYLAPPLKPPIVTSKERFLKALSRTVIQMRALIHSGSSFSWLFKKLPGYYKVNLLGDGDDLLMISP
ncbi:hypothetical protein GLOIN_2v1788498 [Rhizophagus clarus]|uniref:Uncharacterized protein n=1 Tax=Rhizophagus clarus TaxID=94130 RepID=A0A8H3M9K6_9GLOM|nr:hypothetical protein GLOIN_2v1788498 [Rhizophagus clarus]